MTTTRVQELNKATEDPSWWLCAQCKATQATHRQHVRRYEKDFHFPVCHACEFDWDNHVGMR